MSEAPCQKDGCNLTVQLPGEPAVASVSAEEVPPPEHEVVVMCPQGHRSVYMVRA
jgi:hypothetical protein